MKTVRTNQRIGGSTEYTNFPHISLTMFQGVPIGSGPSGLFKCCCGVTDSGEEIDSYFEPLTSNIGHIGATRLRYLYLEIKCTADMEVDITVDDEYKRTITVPSTDDKFVYVEVGVGRDIKGNFWNFRVRNTGGGIYSLNSIHCLPQHLHKGRK